MTTSIVRTALLALWCFMPLALHAQRVQGTVTTEAGTPIVAASIAVLNTYQGAVSDASGAFTLSLPDGGYRLQVSAVGYATVVRSITVEGETDLPPILLAERRMALDEVIVTAQKIEESLVDAPVAVTSLSAETIQNTRTWDLASLTGLIPNYLYQELGVGFQQIQSIRGVQVFSENPAVATYVDGVNALDILAGGLALTDIERIDVLRGPQGTLFGRNAMGGVVNITTRPPSNRRAGFAEASFGDLALQRYAAGIRTPLVANTLFLGLNGLYSTRDGFLTNDTTGTFFPLPDASGARVGGETSLYGNATLTWVPSAAFSASLNLKRQQSTSDGSGFFVASVDEVTALARPDVIALSRVGSHEYGLTNAGLQLNYYGDAFRVSSQSSYQRIGLQFEDIDSGGIFSSYFDETVGEPSPPQEVLSQEIRINSREDRGWLQYTAGIYLFQQTGYEPSTNLVFQSDVDTYVIFRNKSENSGFAAFGQATYPITDRLALTAGLRYDVEDRESTFNGFGDAVFAAGDETVFRPDTTLGGSYTALSPRVALAYAVSDAANLYVSFTRGFRAGGVNAQRLPAGLSQTFDPEFSSNYEVGYKSTLADNRLFLSLSAFAIQWTDLQFFNLVGPFTFTRENVGDASSMGIEFEATALPVENLRIDAGLGLMQTEYQDFTITRADPSTFESVQIDISGNQLANAPGSTLFLAAQYEAPVNDRIRLILRGEVRRIGDFYTDIQNALSQPAYAVVNTRAGVATTRFGAFFWVQNLTDERYLVYGSADTSFNRNARVAPPRALGVTLTASF